MAKRYFTLSFHNGGRKEDAKDTKGTVRAKKSQANREHNIRDEEYCKNQEHIGFKNKTEQEHEEWAKTHIILDEKPEDAYERIFGEAIEKYDEKQKRSDRKIKSGKKYYEKIKNSKNKVPVYEYIMTLGNKDNLPDNPEEVRLIYIEALEEFKKRNPNMEVIGAYYHDDETRDDGKGGRIQGAPHMHVDYIPVSRNRWQNFIDEQNKKESLLDKLTGKEIEKKTRVNGLDVENSLTEALADQGFINKELDVSVIEKKFGIHIAEKHYKDPERQAQYEAFMSSRVDEKGRQIKTRLLTAQMQWIKNERDCLIRLFEKHGYKIKNPGEHRQHLDTQDYIESKDKNIQERNISLYNELSTRLDYIDEEERELAEKEKLLKEKEEALAKKEAEQAQKEKEQTELDAILESKVHIVEESESQLEEARQLNEETEAYRNDIEQIRADLYQDVKASVDKDYKAKYNELYEVQKSQDSRQEFLDKQKENQDKTELQQQQKADELSEREKSVSNLEAEKKSVEEKEKDISEREEQIKIDAAANQEKETALKTREAALAADRKEYDNAVEKFNEDYAKAEKYFKEQQDNFDKNQKIINDFNQDYESKMAEINDWSIIGSTIQNIEPEKWIEEQLNNAKNNKLPIKTFFKNVGDGIKGFIANVKNTYETLLHGHKRYYENAKGENVCEYSFGTQDFTEMLLDTPITDIEKAITECKQNGKTTIKEMFEDKSEKGGYGFLERHFKKAKEIKREIELTLERTRTRVH